ncbi:MAG: DUF547 domain-containing protein [Xenococcaceae cyanobacterium MO_167.B27]|nr:DUF547 domain-containing protein [Xenococcaceae cyanobacterium MO_167.B27]
MKRLYLLCILLSVVFPIASCGNSSDVSQDRQNSISLENNADILAEAESFNYQDYAEVLKTYVSDRGLVDYEALQANREKLDQFNQALGSVTPSIYNSWSEAEQLAFLINAYNSLTLQSIIDQNPLKKSIRDIPGVWRRRKFELAGNSKTLDNIEHDILRKEFNEPRIHAALVCAAISCPPLRNEPYLPEQIDSQLDDQVRKFIASSHGFKIEQDDNRVYLSSIFKWFGEDWVTSYGIEDKFTGNRKEKAILNFISKYLNESEREYLQEGQYRISYLDYDWSLNKVSN